MASQARPRAQECPDGVEVTTPTPYSYNFLLHVILI